MRRTYLAILAAAAIGLMAACGTTEEPAPVQSDDAATQAKETSEPTGSDEEDSPDPYEVYQELAPEDAPELSRDDALARAVAGCGQDWPDGTTDAALAEAYAEFCE